MANSRLLLIGVLLLFAQPALAVNSPTLVHKNTQEVQQVSKAEKPLIERKRKRLTDLQKQCVSGRVNIKKVCKSFIRETGSTLLSVGLSALGTYCASQVITATQGPTDPTDITSANMSHMNSTMMMAGTLTTAVTSAIGNIMKAMSECRTSEIEGYKQIYQILKKESAEEIKKLPEDIQKALENIDRRLDHVLAKKTPEDYELRDFRFYLHRREMIFLSIPQSSKNIAHYEKLGNVQLREELDKKVENLLSGVPGKLRDTLGAFISKIRDNSILKEGTRAQAYFYGPSGTGKTTFVKNLGQILGLPICEFNLKEGKFEELIGPHYDVTQANLDRPDYEIVGRLALCFIESGIQNPIIFIDEAYESLKAGSTMSADLKRLLDPAIKKLKLYGLRFELDFSRATVILAGNYKLQEEALLRRLPQFTFGALGEEQRRSARDKAFHKAIADLEEVLPEEVVHKVKDEISRYLDFMLEEDMKRNPGAAILEAVVKDTVQHIRTKVLKKVQLKEDDIKKFIKESFEQSNPTEESKAPM